MSSAALDLDSNVTIKCIDEYGNITRQSEIHNKATTKLVEGLLRFLCGDFDITKYNSKEEWLTSDEASKYIPTKLHLGTVGVRMSDRDSKYPKLIQINSADFKKPTFDDYKLQEDITPRYTDITGQVLKFDTVEITTFDDPNNSMGLLLQVFLPIGKLVGVGRDKNRVHFTDYGLNQLDEEDYPVESGKGWSYYNSKEDEYQAVFTELGLMSSTNELLARVLFNSKVVVNPETSEIIYDMDNSDNNPIIQSDSSALVVEWRIGIISLGQNDHVVSGANPIPTVSPNIPTKLSN